MVVQFGELDFTNKPNRTARYIDTARKALDELGDQGPGAATCIVRHARPTSSGDLSTIIVKRTPFTAAEVDRFTQQLGHGAAVADPYARRAMTSEDGIVSQLVVAHRRRS